MCRLCTGTIQSTPSYLHFPHSLSELIFTQRLAVQSYRIFVARPREQSGHNLRRSGLFILIIMFTTLEFVFLILAQSWVHWTINNCYPTELTCYCDSDKTAVKPVTWVKPYLCYHRTCSSEDPPPSKRLNKIVLPKNVERCCVVLNHNSF